MKNLDRKLLDFFRKAEEAGVIDDIEAKVVSRADENRASLAARLAEARKRPPEIERLSKKAEAAQAARVAAIKQLEAANTAKMCADSAAMAADNEWSSSITKIEREMQAVAPPFLTEWWLFAGKISEATKLAGGNWINHTFSNFQGHFTYHSNWQDIEKVQSRITEIRQEMVALVYLPKSTADLRTIALRQMAEVVKLASPYLDFKNRVEGFNAAEQQLVDELPR